MSTGRESLFAELASRYGRRWRSTEMPMRWNWPAMKATRHAPLSGEEH